MTTTLASTDISNSVLAICAVLGLLGNIFLFIWIAPMRRQAEKIEVLTDTVTQLKDAKYGEAIAQLIAESQDFGKRVHSIELAKAAQLGGLLEKFATKDDITELKQHRDNQNQLVNNKMDRISEQVTAVSAKVSTVFNLVLSETKGKSL